MKNEENNNRIADCLLDVLEMAAEFEETEEYGQIPVQKRHRYSISKIVLEDLRGDLEFGRANIES